MIGRLQLEVRQFISRTRRSLPTRLVHSAAHFVTSAYANEGSSFLRNGEYLDQVLWSIVSDDWLQAKAVWGPRVIH